MTFIAAEPLPDSAAVADEHFLLHPWHYHGPFWSRLHADRLAPSTHADANLRQLPLPGVTSRPDSFLSIALLVDDDLRHSSSVEVMASINNFYWRLN
jgi:hypothetical protein